MIAILLLAGCLMAGLVIARAINTVTGETTEENEARNLAVFLLFLAVAALGALAVFGGVAR
jgi:hypothetical protein